MSDGYYAGLLFAWAARVVLIASVFAVVAMLGGCGHTLNTSSTGTLTREPSPSTNTTAN